MRKEIIVLAKSRKHANYCVAGIDTTTGNWVRLVTDDEGIHNALSRQDMTYQDNTECEIFHKIEVWGDETPIDYQPENFQIDRNRRMQKLGVSSLREVLNFHTPENERFAELFGSSRASLTHEEATRVGRSLALIYVPSIHYAQDIREDGTVRTSPRATFSYNNHEYSIPVTDEDYEKAPLFEPEGGAVVLIVSLGELFNERHYKLIAAIIKAPFIINGRLYYANPHTHTEFYHTHRDCRYLNRVTEDEIITEFDIKNIKKQGYNKLCYECKLRDENMQTGE